MQNQKKAKTQTNNENTKKSEEQTRTQNRVFKLTEMKAKLVHKAHQRGFFMIPSLITITAMAASFYAIIAASKGQFDVAAILIMLSAFIDGIDGKVARAMNASSDFGVQLDSIADMLSFGTAPAIIAFYWGVTDIGFAGYGATFIYVVCAALRLARFNVASDTRSSRYFTGMPSPAAAGIISVIIWNIADLGYISGATSPLWVQITVPATFILVGLSMVSILPYRSIKKELTVARGPMLVGILVVSLYLLLAFDPAKAMLGIALGYASQGPVFYTLKKIARRRKYKALQKTK